MALGLVGRTDQFMGDRIKDFHFKDPCIPVDLALVDFRKGSEEFPNAEVIEEREGPSLGFRPVHFDLEIIFGLTGQVGIPLKVADRINDGRKSHGDPRNEGNGSGGRHISLL